MKNLSVIIPYSRGHELRQRGLARLMWCLQDQLWDNCKPTEYELIVSEVVYKDKERHYLPFSVDKHIVKVQDGGRFNKSWAINSGMREAKYENVLVLDADIRFDTDYLQKVMLYAQDKDFFMGFNVVRLDRGLDNMHQRTMEIKDIRAVALSFFIKKQLFWDVGGSNEKYYGYGNEDNDLWCRIRHTLKFDNETPALPYEIQHTYHHWHREGTIYPLNPDRVAFYDKTKADTQREIDRLKSLNLGLDKPCEELING